MLRKYRHLIPVLLLGILYLSSCSPRYTDSDGWMFFGTGKRKGIVQTARGQLGVRYKYGGITPRGFDCSGLTSYVYKRNGIQIPRSARAQYSKGKKINRKQIKPGDLVFFQTSGRGISHVGIYTSNGRFIHAPRTGKKVSYESINNTYWRRRYRGAATYLR